MGHRNQQPNASRLVLLSQLLHMQPYTESGQKVRFLGCVQNYNASTATLELVHSATTPGKNTVVYVDITAVLETVKHTELEVGAWINVVGYLVKVPRKASDSKHSRSVPRHAYVQAIMLWSAGSVKLDEYEASVKQFQQAIPN